MAAGIRHGVHHYEAMELLHPPHRFSFGVRFNEATPPEERSENE